jgi:K+-transporting ATPase c subunit
MTSSEQELNDLALADRHILEAQTRIDEQQLRVAALRQSGSGLDQAVDLLATMEQTLEQFRAHRLIIVQRLGGQ